MELVEECKKLRDKCNDLESRSRRNNIRLVGVAEKEENGRPTEFIAELLPKLLGVENFTKPIVIDRAHKGAAQTEGRPSKSVCHQDTSFPNEGVNNEAGQREIFGV